MSNTLVVLFALAMAATIAAIGYFHQHEPAQHAIGQSIE
jgi:hypothetical protein